MMGQDCYIYYEVLALEPDNSPCRMAKHKNRRSAIAEGNEFAKTCFRVEVSRMKTPDYDHGMGEWRENRLKVRD